jgi:hypothetical protein
MNAMNHHAAALQSGALAAFFPAYQVQTAQQFPPILK